MTEKRFIRTIAGGIYDSENDSFIHQDYAGKPIEYEDECIKLLNELHEENRKLQRHLDVMRSGALTDDKRIKELYDEKEQLKQQMKKLESQLYCPYDSICIQCNNEYLVRKKEYYVSKCKKGHEQCSKVDVKYCDDFELKGDVE